jgi:hypothetical protein
MYELLLKTLYINIIKKVKLYCYVYISIKKKKRLSKAALYVLIILTDLLIEELEVS